MLDLLLKIIGAIVLYMLVTESIPYFAWLTRQIAQTEAEIRHNLKRRWKRKQK